MPFKGATPVVDETEEVPAKITWGDAKQAIEQHLGSSVAGGYAMGPGAIPNDVRFGKEHVLGLAASVPLAIGASAALTAGGAATLAGAAGRAYGAYEGQKEAGHATSGMGSAVSIPARIAGGLTGAFLPEVAGSVLKSTKAAIATKVLKTIATAEKVAPAVEAAPVAAKVAETVAEAAPAITKAASGAAVQAERAQVMFKAVKDAVAQGQKFEGAKVWFKLENGVPTKMITPGQAGALAESEKTWISNLWAKSLAGKP